MAPSARPLPTRRLHSKVLHLFARRGRLAYLVVETLILPDHAPLADIPHCMRHTETFVNLRVRTIAMVPQQLLWTPKVNELALNIVDADPDGSVVRATAAAPHTV
jgi:hypothetical protein